MKNLGKKINSKRKGNKWELNLAKWLRLNGIKAYRESSSGGGNAERGDIINNMNFTIESKAAKNINLMEWWRQVCHSASMHHNSPVLFIHQDGMARDSWLVVMESGDWLELIKQSNELLTQKNIKVNEEK